MTPAARSAISVGVKTALIGAGLIGIVGMAQQLVIYRPEFELRKVTVDAQFDELRGLVLDFGCAQNPTHRRCK